MNERYCREAFGKDQKLVCRRPAGHSGGHAKRESSAWAIMCIGGPHDGVLAEHTANRGGKRVRAEIPEVHPAGELRMMEARELFIGTPKRKQPAIVTTRGIYRYDPEEGVYWWEELSSDFPPRQSSMSP